MSSPVNPVPPVMPPPIAPAPPFRRHRRRSFSGPFVLIVIGIVFLLGNLHLLSWIRLGRWYAHYWPVLLILWGVIKLIEYQQSQREGLPSPGIGVGGIFLVMVLVVSGLIATQAARISWGEIRDNMGIDDSDISDIFGDKYNFDDHLEQDFPASASLKIIDSHGGVSVHASEDNRITVVVRKRVGADSQEAANKYDEATKPTITVIGGLVTVDAKTDAAGDHFVQTDLDVSLPRKASVNIVSRRGDVTVATREGDLDVTHQHGDVSVEDVKGNIKLSLEKDSAKIEQITGNVHVEGRLNEVSVSDVSGTAQLDGEFQERVKLSRIKKNVTFKSSRTDMEFSKIDGDLDLDSDDLRAEQIAGPLRLTTRSKNIHLDAVSGDVRLQDENGNVEVEMRSLGNVQIDNRKGEIQLTLPEKPGFRFDAHVRDGEIQSEFPEIKVGGGEREASASGSVGNAASHVVINNEHGGIEIQKASLEPPRPPEPPAPGKPGKTLTAPKEKVEPTEN
jgi:putative adhesin/cell wall-active antibiotic response 4TMS protein YvqF